MIGLTHLSSVPSGLIGPGDADPTPVGGLLLAIAQKRPPMSHRRGVLVERCARCGGCCGECGGDEYRQWRGLFSRGGDMQKIIELARLCSRVLKRGVTRPVIPHFLAVAGLPFIQLYAAMRNQPPILYPK